MPGFGQLFGVDEIPCLLSDFLCHFSIDVGLDKFNSDRWKVLYIREQRLLNGELLDFGDTKLQFTDPPSDPFVFNLNVVVRQGVNLFDGGFDDISVECLESLIFAVSYTDQLPEGFE